jgi:TPR repeat protein
MERKMYKIIVRLTLLACFCGICGCMTNQVQKKYYEKGRYEMAIDNFREKAEEQDAFLKLAYQYYEKDEFKAAAKWFHSSATQGNAYAQCALGCMYRDGLGVIKNYREAVKWFKKSAAQQNPYAQNALAYLWAIKGETVGDDEYLAEKAYHSIIGSDLNTALKMSESAVKKMPDKGEFIDTLGWIYYKQDRYKDAVETLEKAVKLTSHPVVKYHLGEAYYKAGQPEKAMAMWQEALKVTKDNVLIKKLDRSIEDFNRQKANEAQ